MKIKKDNNKKIVHFTEYLRVLLAAIGSTRVMELKSSDAGGHTLHTSRQRVGGQRTWALHVGWRLSIVRGSCGHARSLTRPTTASMLFVQSCFRSLEFCFVICGSSLRSYDLRVVRLFMVKISPH